MLQKLYPSCVGAPLAGTFKLVFLAEGYGPNERHLFLSACADFYHWLLATPPFNVTRFSPGWLTIFAGFRNPGAASASAGSLAIDAATLGAALDLEALRDRDETLPFADIFKKGAMSFGVGGGLIVLLLPPASPDDQIEHLPGAGEYHFLAVTAGSQWQQVVLRAMGPLLGLQSEADGPGQAPATDADKMVFGLNVEYLPVPPGLGAAIKWKVLGGSAATATSQQATGSIPDTHPTTPDRIEYWKGGAGFQNDIYRSAKDCLMRRNVSDPSASLRARRIPLCLACRSSLLWNLAAL